MQAQATGLTLFRLKQTIGEASSLAPVVSPDLLKKLGAEAACWVVHDEHSIQTAVSILSVRKDTFTVTPVHLDTGRPTRTADAESVYVYDGRVTVVGSAFVGRKGTIDPRRAFIATFEENEIRLNRSGKRQRAAGFATVTMLGLELTAAANACLERAGTEITPPSKVARKAAKKAGLPGGVPINIEGTSVDADGVVTLGLRSPVAKSGDPILLRLDGDLQDGVRSVQDGMVGVLQIGADPKEPVGVRDLAVLDGRTHMILAHADSTMIADPTRRAPARHVSVDSSGGDLVIHRDFGNRRRVEGLARPAGVDQLRSDGWWYVIDDEKSVVVLSAT